MVPKGLDIEYWVLERVGLKYKTPTFLQSGNRAREFSMVSRTPGLPFRWKKKKIVSNFFKSRVWEINGLSDIAISPSPPVVIGTLETWSGSQEKYISNLHHFFFFFHLANIWGSSKCCSWCFTNNKHYNSSYWDFPGGPMAKTRSSQCRGLRFDPSSGN